MIRRTRFAFLVLAMVLATAACGTDEPEPTENGAADQEEGCTPGEEVETESGLRYREVTCGEGEAAERGQRVLVHYEGRHESGTIFESSYERDEPLPFVLGAGDVIEGWDEGIAGMQVGGLRRLVIPPELAYGEDGSPPFIGPDATLVFEVELLEISGP